LMDLAGDGQTRYRGHRRPYADLRFMRIRPGAAG
jgi:hypothetical protein